MMKVPENLAAEVATKKSAVESRLPDIPESSGNLVRDVCTLCGLTIWELGELIGRTERSVRRWHENRPPASVRPQLEAMQAIGLTLIGGLGSGGVRRWLTTGRPSPLERIRAGQVAEVAKQVRAYEDSVVT